MVSAMANPTKAPHDNPHEGRPGKRIGNVGRAYLEARAAQADRNRRAIRRIAEASQ